MQKKECQKFPLNYAVTTAKPGTQQDPGFNHMDKKMILYYYLNGKDAKNRRGAQRLSTLSLRTFAIRGVLCV
jgi:hypothetical protein